MEENYTRENVSDSEIILNMQIPADALKHSYNELLSKKSESLDIKGFRKGKVPNDLIEPQLETLLLTETFEQLAPYYVNAAIIKEKIQPVAPPEYTGLEELDKSKPVKFKVKITVMPQFTLGDLSKINVDKSKIEVTDEEVDNTLSTMFGNNQEGDEKKEKMDDAWAKKIAEEYKFEEVNSLNDLKEKIRELLARQKQNIVDQNRTAQVMREAVEISEIKIPPAAIKFEAEQRENAFNQDLERAGVTLDDFLKQRETTLTDLRSMWLKDAQEAIENDVLLKMYADKHEVTMEDKELASEIEMIKQSARQQYEMEHAGHDHESHFDEAIYDDPQWQEQVRGYLLKQKAYQELLKEILGEEIMNETAANEPKKDEKEVKKESPKKETKNKSTKSGEKKGAKTEKEVSKKAK